MHFLSFSMGRVIPTSKDACFSEAFSDVTGWTTSSDSPATLWTSSEASLVASYFTSDATLHFLVSSRRTEHFARSSTLTSTYTVVFHTSFSTYAFTSPVVRSTYTYTYTDVSFTFSYTSTVVYTFVLSDPLVSALSFLFVSCD